MSICERVKKRPRSNISQLPPVLNKLKTAAPARSPIYFTCRLTHPCSNNQTGLFPNQIAIASTEGRGLGPIHTMRHVSVPSTFHQNDMSYNSSHLRTNSINFSSNSGDKPAALVASKHLKCSDGDVRLFTLSESSKYRPVRTRSVTSNILVQKRRRNGTET
jgi:hypothetical protein